MSSKASATVLLIRGERARFFELQLLLQDSPLQVHSFSALLVALILARHFPVKILLIFMDPAANIDANTVSDTKQLSQKDSPSNEIPVVDS